MYELQLNAFCKIIQKPYLRWRSKEQEEGWEQKYKTIHVTPQPSAGLPPPDVIYDPGSNQTIVYGYF